MQITEEQSAGDITKNQKIQIFPSIILFAIICIMAVFVGTIKKELENAQIANLNEMAEHDLIAANNVINERYLHIDRLVHKIRQEAAVFDKKTIHEILHDNLVFSSFSQFYLVDEELNCYGARRDFAAGNWNPYAEMFSSSKQFIYHDTENVFNDENSKDTIIYGKKTAPFLCKDIKIIGVIAIDSELFLKDYFLFDSYNGKGFSTVIDQKGNPVLRDVFESQDNFYDILKEAWISKTTYKDIMNQIESGKTVSTVYADSSTKKSYYIKLLPIQHTGWYFLMQIPKSVLRAQTGKITGSSILLLSGMVVLVMVLLFYLKRNISLQKKLDITNKINEQASLITTTTNIYYVVYFLDLETNTHKEIRAIKTVSDFFVNFTKTDVALQAMIPVFIQDKYQQLAFEFAKPSEWQEKLQHSDFIAEEFEGKVTGWFRMNIIPVKRSPEGKPTKVLLTIQNIHEEKLRELEQKKLLEQTLDKAQEASKSKTLFLSNMSHDIRTPLNAILGFSDLAAKHISEPEVIKDYLNKINLSGEMLLKIINNVLEIARIDSGKTKIDAQVGNIQESVENNISVFQKDIDKKNLTLIKTINVKNPYIVFDETHSTEIVMNLLSNAVKYTDNGGTIKVTLEQLPYKNYDWCLMCLTIEDNGIGMSEEFKSHLFEAFEREKTSTVSGIQGTGLGMGIVKRLVELADGTIEVNSELGIGTTFKVRIPYLMASRQDIIEKTKPLEIQQDIFRGKRILLAEDNDLNAEIAIDLLSETGLEVDRAEDGVICVSKLQKAPDDYYSAILMDIQMPNMDGYKATHAIRRMQETKKADIPIIAMTANAFAEDKELAMKAGMNGHIAKPIDIKIVYKELTQYLK